MTSATTITPTAYDTAWIASIPAEHSPNAPRFPAAIRWLVDHQLADGSWGSSIPYEHDRLLCTLAAVVPLAQFGQTSGEHAALRSGIRYLQEHGTLLSPESMELVAFELLLPTLVARAQRAGVSVPIGLDLYGPERTEKLGMIPAASLYSPGVTVVHSLEFLGDGADLAGLGRAQGPNGSIGNSPAATAFFFSRTANPAALAYLDACMASNGGQSAPVLHPCDTFEVLWSAYHLHLAGLPTNHLIDEEVRHLLVQSLRDDGVSLDPTFPIPDADDTAVALILLKALGLEVDPSVLQRFEAPDGHFYSFPFERHPSAGVNIHVLHALLTVPGYVDVSPRIDDLLDYLASQQTAEGYWLDKWHISPLYATSHALAVFTQLKGPAVTCAQPMVDRARAWLRTTQNRDGSWGCFGQATAEETAYALLALAALDPDATCVSDREKRTDGLAYLNTTLDRGTLDMEMFPAMWIDKCLYTPTPIVEAVIRAARAANRTLARQPELVA